MPTNVRLYDQFTNFFLEQFHIEVPSMDTDLIEDGLLDSLMFVQLLLYIEETFGTKIHLEDIDIDNFRSIAKISEFLVNHRPTERIR